MWNVVAMIINQNDYSFVSFILSIPLPRLCQHNETLKPQIWKCIKNILEKILDVCNSHKDTYKRLFIVIKSRF